MDDPEPYTPEEEEKLRRIEEELERVKAEGLSPDPAAERDLDEKLDQLKSTVDRARSSHDAAKSEANRPTGIVGGQSSYGGLGNGLVVAYALIGPPVLGWLVGWLMDRSSGGSSGQMYGVLIGAVVGLIAVVVVLQRIKS